MGLQVFLANYDTYIILETSENSTFKELKLGLAGPGRAGVS